MVEASVRRTNFIQEAIRKAHEEAEKKYNDATIITEHENGSKTTTTFYKKGKAIWCKMTTGFIETNSRVYKIDTDKPYIRDMGRYWYLDAEHIKAMKAAI